MVSLRAQSSHVVVGGQGCSRQKHQAGAVGVPPDVGDLLVRSTSCGKAWAGQRGALSAGIAAGCLG